MRVGRLNSHLNSRANNADESGDQREHCAVLEGQLLGLGQLVTGLSVCLSRACTAAAATRV